MIPRYLLFWLATVVIAVTNGVLRQALLVRLVDATTAGQLSVLTGIILIGSFQWFLVRRWPPRTDREAIVIGLIWLALTLAFEFGLGAARGMTMDQMLADYDIPAGRLWPVLLVFITTAFWMFRRIQARELAREGASSEVR